MDELNFLLSAAIGYANMASTMFNMFLTVLFSSFAFAAALPLKDIGAQKTIFSVNLSSSSILVGFSLLAFYIISFGAFLYFSEKAQGFIELIHTYLKTEGNLPKDVPLMFKEEVALLFKNPQEIMGISISSIGFILGASIGLFIFLWITNADRRNASN